MLRKIVLIMMFLLLSCSLAYADFGDEATVGGQDSSGNYRWRVTSDGDLIPGTTATNDVGTTAKAVNEVHATTLYVTDGYSSQGKVASYSYTSSGSVTISLAYGIITKNIPAGVNTDTITVPDGTYAGQQIRIIVDVDNGGHLWVIPTTKSGYTKINMDASLDQVELTWISASVGWVISGQFGVTLE
jgi:hypothetical protein